MKRATYSLLIILSFVLLQKQVLGTTDILPSLSWQRSMLEKDITSKVKTIIESILQDDSYQINVDVQTKKVVTPEWNGSGGEDAANAKGKKSEIDKKEDRKSNALIKFVDPEEATDIGDYIVLNKFGLEAPLIDDFNDFQPDGKITLSVDAGVLGKAPKKKESKQTGEIEKIWKYNNSVDVYENLKSVNVLVRLSESLDDNVKQNVEKYIKSIKFNLGKIKPEIKIEYTLLGRDITDPGVMGAISNFFDYFSRFATFLGIVIGVILFGVVGKKLIEKFFELSDNSGSQSNISMDSPENDKEEEDDALGGGAGGGGGGDDGLGILGLNGVERFKGYMASSERDAILLVKKWLSEDDKRGKRALKALVQQMENDILAIIFKTLSDIERSDWRALLDGPLSNEEIAGANDYISNQIVQNVIIPNSINDPETYDLILKLKPEQVAEIAKDNIQIASYLFNVFSLPFLQAVLDKCSPEIREAVLTESAGVDSREVLSNQGKIKSVLAGIVEVVKPKPFVDKMMKLIPIATPDIEEVLYDNLIANRDKDEIISMASKYFPSGLISMLPKPFLKEVLSAYPLTEKTKLLLTVAEDVKLQFMEIFAPAGSKASDLMELEFENYQNDEAELDRVQNESAEHWKGFVDFTREQIKRDKKYSSQVKELISTWINNKSGGDNVQDIGIDAA